MNLVDKIQKDWLEKLEPMLRVGYYIDPTDFLMKKQYKGVGIEAPWIYHVKNDSPFKCVKWHTFLFNCYGEIPLECFDCYKVVVRPSTVEDLFKLREVQKKLPTTIPCKSGIELRPIVGAKYGGYFYNRGLPEGLDKLDFVRQLCIDNNIKVTDGINHDCDVLRGIYLKRACTEYETKFGDSDKWVHNPVEREISAYLDRKVHPSCFESVDTGPDEEQCVEHSWVNFAHDKGDLTYMNLTDNEPLYEPAVKYERGAK